MLAVLLWLLVALGVWAFIGPYFVSPFEDDLDEALEHHIRKYE